MDKKTKQVGFAEGQEVMYGELKTKVLQKLEDGYVVVVPQHITVKEEDLSPL